MRKKLWVITKNQLPIGLYAESRQSALELAREFKCDIAFAGNLTEEDARYKLAASEMNLKMLRKQKLGTECPHNKHILCTDRGGNVITMRPCNRCAWGPNAEYIYERRIAVWKKKNRKENANEGAADIPPAPGRDIPPERE